MKFTNGTALMLGLISFAMQPLSYAEVTSTDILNTLVDEGVLTEEKAKSLVEKVRQREQRATEFEQQGATVKDSTVRVKHVPDYVKSEIKTSLKSELVGELQDNVVEQARKEGWGIEPAPNWVHRIKLSGDVRIRYQGQFFPPENPNLAVYNLAKVNDAGSVDAAGRDAFVNTIEERHVLRSRARVKLTAQPAKGFEAGIRLTTGNQGNPVSANQTLGNYGAKWDTSIDLAYIQYETVPRSWKIIGGRFENQWLHTDLVWDSDMTFEGLSTSYFPMRSETRPRPTWDPYITLGAFPIEEINEVILPGDIVAPPNDDKWLYAAQLGNAIHLSETQKLEFALAMYYYENITGERNALNQDVLNSTASPFYQFGNVVQNIIVVDDTGLPASELYALASKYQLVDVTARYTFNGFDKYKLVFTADFVVNKGFDRDEITELLSLQLGDAYVPDRDKGRQLGFEFGTKSFTTQNDWKVSFKYRYLEGDAVLDAFADSDFFMGGTGGKGYILQGDWFMSDGVKMTLKWLSADEIDVDDIRDSDGQLSQSDIEVDTLQLDVTAMF